MVIFLQICFHSHVKRCLDITLTNTTDHVLVLKVYFWSKFHADWGNNNYFCFRDHVNNKNYILLFNVYAPEILAYQATLKFGWNYMFEPRHQLEVMLTLLYVSDVIFIKKIEI